MFQAIAEQQSRFHSALGQLNALVSKYQHAKEGTSGAEWELANTKFQAAFEVRRNLLIAYDSLHPTDWESFLSDKTNGLLEAERFLETFA